MLDLISLIESLSAPRKQEDYFLAKHLEQLFLSKIAKSQATGKDGVRIGRFQESLALEAQLISRKAFAGSYRFTNYKERLILRGAKREPRQISIPTVRDRLTLRAICQVLHEHVPDTVGLSPHALVKRAVTSIKSGDQSGRSFVRIDVRNFFPSISHRLLDRELNRFLSSEMVRNLCLQAVATPTGDESSNVRGVPQGLSISGALSSLYMIRFDEAQVHRNPSYCRYVDDILLICDTAKADDELKRISRALKSRGLIVHPKGSSGKTEIKPVSQGIDFLGYHISVEKVSVRKSSYRKMFINLSKVITDYKYRGDWTRTLFRLNLKITGCIVDKKRRGWMMFFSYTENMAQLAHLDKFVRNRLNSVGFTEDKISLVKRFLKSYRETRFNLSDTKYIPNFDNFDSADKVAAITALSGRPQEVVAAWEAASIDAEFSKLISREVHDLEQDVGSAS